MKKKILKSLSVFMIFALIFINISVKAEAATTGQDIVNYSKTFLGTPYVWGGTTPSGFDCSGFTQYVYKHFGIDITRTTYTQINVGTAVSRSELQLGDLVFTSAGHVGLYVGNNQIIHSPQTGDVVKISTIWSFYAARRVADYTNLIGWYHTSDWTWYYYESYNVLKKGWLFDNNNWYYMELNDGHMLKGWVQDKTNDKGLWYFMDETYGHMLKGWIENNGKKYYLNETYGHMEKGWVKLGGYWYHFNTIYGHLDTNTVIDGYTVDGNGVAIGKND